MFSPIQLTTIPTFGQCGAPFLAFGNRLPVPVTTVGEPQTPAEIIRQRQKKNTVSILLVPAATATRIQFSSSRLALPPLADAAAAARLLPNSETVVNCVHLSKMTHQAAQTNSSSFLFFRPPPATGGSMEVVKKEEAWEGKGRMQRRRPSATTKLIQHHHHKPVFLFIKRACPRILARSSRGWRKVPGVRWRTVHSDPSFKRSKKTYTLYEISNDSSWSSLVIIKIKKRYGELKNGDPVWNDCISSCSRWSTLFFDRR